MAKKNPKKTVTGRVLHDPVKDKLRPIFPLDLSKISTINDLVCAMGDTAYTARQIGDAADVLEVNVDAVGRRRGEFSDVVGPQPAVLLGLLVVLLLVVDLRERLVAADLLNLIDHLGVEGEDALHALPKAHLANRKGALRPVVDRDDEALESLQTLLISFFDPHLHANLVAGHEVGEIGALQLVGQALHNGMD